ncbi:unnamed protein product [Owenia fusiformis]|uniref:Uncharacterized protein n=1 Tax=Owenia fusiformis TaxID=6347 RepID=A0A8J1XXB6_OWEFU|nr:unnamed protein product [Owenia fusiformis]
MKASSRPVVSALRRRLFSAQAASQESATQPLQKQQAKVSKLPNGVTVASLENYSPVTRVAVVFGAGARNEPGNALGVTHCLRRAAFLTNATHTQFGITRNIQQLGASITCTSGRDTMTYTVEATRDNIEKTIPYLASVTTTPDVREWELNDLQACLEFDIASLKQSPSALTMEALHDAAYRGTLGRSLYAPSCMVGQFTPDTLEDYMRNFYTSERMSLVGLGIDHDTLVSYASQFNPTDGPGLATEKAFYRGGEIRMETRSDVVNAAVVTEGAGLGSKDLLALGALQRVMGCGDYLKWGSGSATSKVQQTATGITPLPVAVNCFNANYADSGVFGFFVTAKDTCVGKVLKGVAKQFSALTKSGVSQDDLNRAKAQLKASLMMSGEDPNAVIADLVNGSDMSEVAAAIDALTVADVSNVAKKVINGKPSMAAVGNLENVPYLDQVFN